MCKENIVDYCINTVASLQIHHTIYTMCPSSEIGDPILPSKEGISNRYKYSFADMVHFPLKNHDKTGRNDQHQHTAADSLRREHRCHMHQTLPDPYRYVAVHL